MDVQDSQWLTEARVLRAQVDLRRRALVFHFDSKRGAWVIFETLQNSARRILFLTPDWMVLVGYRGDQATARVSQPLRPPRQRVPVMPWLDGQDDYEAGYSGLELCSPAELRWYGEAPSFQRELLVSLSQMAYAIACVDGQEVAWVPLDEIEVRADLKVCDDLEVHPPLQGAGYRLN